MQQNGDFMATKYAEYHPGVNLWTWNRQEQLPGEEHAGRDLR
jgi:hypothetical protein